MVSADEPDSAPRGCRRGFSSSESNPRVKSVLFVRRQMSQQHAQAQAGFSAWFVFVVDSPSRSMALKAPEMPQKCACSCFGARSSRRNFGASLHKTARKSEIRGHRIRAQRDLCKMAKCLCMRADAEHVELSHLRVRCDLVVSSSSGLSKSIGMGGRRRGAQPRWCSRGFPYTYLFIILS